ITEAVTVVDSGAVVGSGSAAVPPGVAVGIKMGSGVGPPTAGNAPTAGVAVTVSRKIQARTPVGNCTCTHWLSDERPVAGSTAPCGTTTSTSASSDGSTRALTPSTTVTIIAGSLLP